MLPVKVSAFSPKARYNAAFRVAVAFTALVLSGCADLDAELSSALPPPEPQAMKLSLSEDFASVEKESEATHNGPLVGISSIGDINFKSATNVSDDRIAHQYDPYEIYEPKHDFTEQGPRQQVLVFRKSTLVLITDANSFASDMEPMLKVDREKRIYGDDYNLAVKYSTDFGSLPSSDQLAALRNNGIRSTNDLNAAEEEFQTLHGLYSNMAEFRTFLQDRLVASRKHIPIERAAKLRKKHERVKAARERAAYIRKYPYEAVMTCGHVGINIGQCFIGPAQVRTELELKNGNAYHMYRFSDVNSAGKYEPDGFIIPLRRHFSLKAQNALNFFLLNVTIRNTKTHSVLFQKSAAQFGVIGVEN